MTCNSQHPEDESLRCARVTKQHPLHTVKIQDDFINWKNESFKPSRGVKDNSGDAQSKRKLRAMADRTRGPAPRQTRSYLPTESDPRGKVALYLLKYLGEWISQEELEHPEIARSAAGLCIKEIKNHYGWPIEIKTEDGQAFYKLDIDPRPSSVLG